MTTTAMAGVKAGVTGTVARVSQVRLAVSRFAMSGSLRALFNCSAILDSDTDRLL